MGKGDNGKPEKDPAAGDIVTRELALGDLLDGGSTLDCVICAEARFKLMAQNATDKEDMKAWGKGGKGDPVEKWAELIVTVLLHLVVQFFQFVILLLFSASTVKEKEWFFLPEHINNKTTAMSNSILLNNATIAKPFMENQPDCRSNLSYPWLHRLMLFVWVSKMMPEIANGLWRMYRIWLADDVENHDVPTKPQEFLARLEKMDKNKPFADFLAEQKKAYAKKEGKKQKWWRKEKINKEWKDRLLVIDKDGCGRKAESFEPGEQDYPITIDLCEVDEVHEIGQFSLVWKIFITVFALIPSIFLNLYTGVMGAKLIALTGDLGKLVKTALKLKFLLKIPESIFDGYASGNLKNYIDGTSYVVPAPKGEIDIWGKWLSTATKLVLAWALAVSVYYGGFHGVYEFRKLCSSYYATFPHELCTTSGVDAPTCVVQALW